jgi:SAM-dependent methyltransferase
VTEPGYRVGEHCARPRQPIDFARYVNIRGLFVLQECKIERRDSVMTTSAGEFVTQVAPGLIRESDRFFAVASTDKVSYPLSAQAQLAAVEESSFWFRHRNDVIGSLVRRFPPSGPIVEIGGGNGHVSLGLARLGFSTIVLEPGAGGAEVAHSRGLAVIRAAFTPETFVAGTLPAIGLFDVIEHIANAQQFLTDCRRALVPGGTLYITVPAFQSLWSSDDEFAGHYRRYSHSSLKRVLRGAGFEIAFMSAFFSLLVIPLFLLRALPSALGWRKVSTIDQAVAHHQIGGQTSDILKRLQRWEIAAVRNGHTVPLGTSLIAVARKLATEQATVFPASFRSPGHVRSS